MANTPRHGGEAHGKRETTGHGGNAGNRGNQGASSTMDKAREAASSVADQARDAASHLADKARDAASNLSEQASHLAGRAGDVASEAGRRAGDALSSVGGQMHTLAGTIRQNVPHEGTLGTAASAVADSLESGASYLEEHGLGDMAGDLETVIRRYPIPSVLVGFGLGFLMAKTFRS